MTQQTTITPIDRDSAALARINDIMSQAGQAANQQSARVAFADHTASKADNTIRRKRAHLALFEEYLQLASVPATGLYDSPHTWRSITWGNDPWWSSSGTL